jgi:N-acyl homoserine lactone hydrolase
MIKRGIHAKAVLFGGFVALSAIFALAAAGVQASALDREGLPALPRVTSPRLYVIDCGTLISSRPEEFGLTRDEVFDSNLSSACFLVIHPKGILLYDTGLPDRLVGRPIYENVRSGYGQIKFQTLRGQLADIGVRPQDITYLALSHSHFDHVGNANDYAGSIWLAQKTELPLMFGPRATAESPGDFAALAHARTQIIAGDHDVFGDGSVVLKFAPGHTPGHQCLYVKLAKTGGVLIAGDLYHHAEERSLDRMPAEERKTATSRSRAEIEQFARAQHAQIWIGHDIGFFQRAVKAPGWYE